MTIRNHIEQLLVKHGLWEQEARAVVKQLELDESSTSMKDRWEDDVEGYPVQLFAILLLNVKLEAVKWIDVNKPQHWTRPMFL